MLNWRKDDWHYRRRRGGSRSDAPRNRERNERKERGRLGRLRRRGGKRRRGGWSDRGSWRGKKRKSVRERLRERRWASTLQLSI